MNRVQESSHVRLQSEWLKVGSGSTLSIVLLYAMGLGVAEAAALVWLAPSLILQALVLLCALIQYGLGPNAPHARVLPIFALISLSRILSLTLPLGRFNPVFLNLLVAVPLLVGVWFTIKLLNLSPRELGLRWSNSRAQLLIAASGLPLGLAVYLIWSPQTINFQNPWMLGLAIMALLVAGFAEELIFRGMLSQTLTQMLGNAGLVISAVLFGLMYLGALSPGLALGMAVIGLVFGIWRNRTQCIWGIGIAHGLLNVMVVIGFQFLFSQTSSLW